MLRPRGDSGNAAERVLREGDVDHARHPGIKLFEYATEFAQLFREAIAHRPTGGSRGWSLGVTPSFFGKSVSN